MCETLESTVVAVIAVEIVADVFDGVVEIVHEECAVVRMLWWWKFVVMMVMMMMKSEWMMTHGHGHYRCHCCCCCCCCCVVVAHLGVQLSSHDSHHSFRYYYCYCCYCCCPGVVFDSWS